MTGVKLGMLDLKSHQRPFWASDGFVFFALAFKTSYNALKNKKAQLGRAGQRSGDQEADKLTWKASLIAVYDTLKCHRLQLRATLFNTLQAGLIQPEGVFFYGCYEEKTD